jgi:hypothetical protein
MCKLIINASTKKIALKKFAKFSKAKIWLHKSKRQGFGVFPKPTFKHMSN